MSNVVARTGGPLCSSGPLYRWGPLLIAALLATGACGFDVPDTSVADDPYGSVGLHPVGTAAFTVRTATRTLPVRVWYPADPSATPSEVALSTLVPDANQARAFAAELSASPAACVTDQVLLAPDAPPAPGPWPWVAFSHCHECLAVSFASIASQLASHGIAVVAPDHVGNTLFDTLTGTVAGVTSAFLNVRTGDIRRVIDSVLDPAGAALPAPLRGRFDPDRLGSFGHSFGAVTAGAVMQADPRPRAGVFVAAPVQNPALPGVQVSRLSGPLMFILATEDNSITEFGNATIRDNYERAPGEAYRVEIEDAGHWSFTDIAGLGGTRFDAGCGDDTRQTTLGVPFTYPPVPEARGAAARMIVAFLRMTLTGDDAAAEALNKPWPRTDVTRKLD